jgi:hypothetical protein
MNDEKIEIIAKLLDYIKSREPNSKNLLVPNCFAKDLISHVSIREDILLVSRTVVALVQTIKGNDINKMDETTVQTIIPALWSSIIINYGRCFTDGKAKLEVKDCFDEEHHYLQKTHENLMELRHTFIAHRGKDTSYDLSVVYLRFSTLEYDPTPTHYKLKNIRNLIPTIELLIECEALFQHILTITENKIHKKANNAHKGFLKFLTNLREEDPRLILELVI